MRLWIFSDIHLELTDYWDLPTLAERPDFDVMIVAGDLIPRMERGVTWLREKVPDRPVIYVAGNHEFYRTDIDQSLAKAREAAAGSNVHILENDSVVIDGVRFVGGTLWTDFLLFGDAAAAMRAAGAQMNDFRLIRMNNYTRRLQPIDALARHMATRAHIDDELGRPFAGPSIVVTHHVPYRAGFKRGYENDIVSAAYVSDLSDLITRHQPALWVYGHTHQSDDTMLGRTRIISNSKGYGPYRRLGLTTWENPSFDPALTIEVDTRLQ